MKEQWIFDKDVQTCFQGFMEVISPSMEEVPMANFLRHRWEEAGAGLSTDVMGNVYASIGENHPLSIGVIAHMDTVAVQITKILPNGMLQLRHIGLRAHTLLGQPMKVFSTNGIIDGVIGFDPTSQYGQPKGLVDEDLWMDIGVSDYQEACTKVQIGDLAVFAPRLSTIGDNMLCGTAIDDRIGLFVMDECLRWFSKHQVPVNLKFIGSSQEEIGLRGSAIIASNTALDACIVLDVDYATDTLTPHENQMGPLLMGKGVGMHIKSDVNPVLRRIAIEVAESNHIDYQLSLGRFIYGGTDSTALQIQRNGVATLNLNIPCRYMHSPVEMCHKGDVESCVRLLIALIEELGHNGKRSFIPGID